MTSASRAVLVAPPGAGKTTLVPPALLGAPWLGDQKIVMLEPRRLAARAAARRMAFLRGERVGETIGYRVHLDTVVGPRTRIEVVTEGVLTRMLQSDATLDGIGAVIFDEFHERSLHADVGLALTLHTQAVVRTDLRVLVMSATLTGEQVARTLDAPIVITEGRAFRVSTEYRPRRDREYIENGTARVIREALAGHPGDVLAFLPGAPEIVRTTQLLRDAISDPAIDVRPLFGDLSGEEQDAAIAPSLPGRRKIVVATNIAETSLTIDGVRVVVDSGLARAPRFSQRTGLTRLETVRISRASADQRRGRAGRTADGVCYRLWAEHDDAQLTPRDTPEILDADLAPLALELAAAGIRDPSELTWLDAPPAGALSQARNLLELLGAISPDGAITPHGAELSRLGTHPRLAHMLVRAREQRHGSLAAIIAALLGRRDILRAGPDSRVDADLRTRIELVARHSGASDVHRGAVEGVRADAAKWRERLGVANDRVDADLTGVLLAFAYPDRIARRRAVHDTRYVLSNGSGAHFVQPDPLGAHEWLVIAETDGRSPDAGIRLAAPAELDELIACKAAALVTADDVRYDDRTERIIAVRRTSLGAIPVKEQALADPPAGEIQAAMVSAIRRAGVDALPWSDNARALRQRLAFLRARDASWPDVSDDALLGSLEEWIEPVVGGARSLAGLSRAALTDALLSKLDRKQRGALDVLAPPAIELPGGRRAAVDYADPSAPSIAVRIQDLFGVQATPAILGGRVPLTLQLLSPARRPVQVTRDLAAFWRGSYAEVRKEMRGRYPRHDWPENPAAAAPGKPRGK